MREELKNIELFDLYNSGKMNATEKLAFEQKLDSSPELQSDFIAYKELMVAYHRSAMSSAIYNHQATTANQLLWKKIGITAAIISTLVIGYLVYSSYSGSTNSLYDLDSSVANVDAIDQIDLTDLPTDTDCLVKEEVIQERSLIKKGPAPQTDFSEEAPVDFGGLKMWTKPDSKTFTLDLKKSEVLQGEEGTIVLVDPMSFLDENGEVVTGSVKLELSEFLTIDKMILANLTTVSNGTNLETDGMLHLKASQNGKKLKINPKKPLQISIPTDKIKADMLVFDGDIKNGNINWVNPKELDKYLVKIDLENLDFLPEDFETKLHQGLPYLARTNVDKQFVDSCYYSLSRADNIQNYHQEQTLSEYRGFESSSGFYPKKGDTSVKSSWYNANLWQKVKSTFTGRYYTRRLTSVITEPDTFYYGLNRNCYGFLQNNINNYKRLTTGVDPAAVQTIRDPKFQDTWIATREFETRLHHLQQLENGQELLDTYCQNLDKPMHQIDSKVIPKINNTEIKKEFKTLLSLKHSTIMNSSNGKELSKFYNTAREENRKKMDQLYNQLGISNKPLVSLTKKDLNSPATRAAYQFSWSGGAWINIDGYLHLLSQKQSLMLPVFTEDSSRYRNVYQYIGFLKNLTRLREQQQAGYIANYPNKSIKESRGERNGVIVSISYQGGNKYRLGVEEFNPYLVDEVNVSYELVNIKQLKKKLKRLDNSKDYLENLKNDVMQIKTQVDQNKKRQRMLKSQEEKGEEAFKFWKPLALIVYLKETIANKIEGERDGK